MRKKTTQEFIEQSKKIHGDKYDYSKTEYKTSKDMVCIICPEHGEFWQKANEHLMGHGCDKCGGTYKLTTEDFIRRAKEIHGNRYDYSKVNYVNSKTDVCIICPEHGEFWQRPHAHLNGRGCNKCHGMCESTDDFIHNAKKVHGDKYDYSKVNYVNSKTEVCIICPEHGEFWQKPVKHLIGHGCKICGNESRRRKNILTKEEFIERAKKIHGDKYDYSKVVYKSMNENVCIICHEKNKNGKEHGEFWQRPADHVNEHGCPTCGLLVSNGENEIYEFLLKYFDQNEIKRHDREILGGKEIDILIPKLNIGFEYNGLKWHSEEFGKDFCYHLDKTEEAKKKGISLIHIFEDEYLLHKEIVLNKVEEILEINSNRKEIEINKCIVKEIEKDVAKDFLETYHIQGYSKCTISYGFYCNNKLMGVMSFLDKKGKRWELVRFASDYHYICNGIEEKLFNRFINGYKPLEVKGFIDRRWCVSTEDNIFTRLGFTLDKITKPNYHYIDTHGPNERIQKGELRKRSFRKKYGLSMKLTETQIAKEIGLSKIWDCGLYRYIWKMGD